VLKVAAAVVAEFDAIRVVVNIFAKLAVVRNIFVFRKVLSVIGFSTLQPYSLKRRLLRGEAQPVLRKGVSATSGGSLA